MRLSEWINLAYFLGLAGLAVLRPVGASRGRQIWLLGAVGAGLTLGGRFSGWVLDADVSRIVRDWVPAVTILPAYWQAGRFFVEPSPKWQRRLASVDERLGALLGPWAGWMRSGSLATYLEAAYFLAYPLVPAGLAVIELLGFSGQADRFWSVVLSSCYGCYAMLPFAPTLPPRLQSSTDRAPSAQPKPLGVFNLWILKYFGIEANTFPSGHVAATTATSLLVLEADPWAGLLFSGLTLSIAIAAVALRYHFFLDIVFGAVLALAFRVAVG